MNRETGGSMTVQEALAAHPFLASWMAERGLDPEAKGAVRLDALPIDLDELSLHVRTVRAFLGEDKAKERSITILPGRDKEGRPESFGDITVSRGEMVAIVGPTGSGKSRLLADIEWMADGDTPTGRCIRIDGERPLPSHRYTSGGRLVAQLSQNMNFVMDVNVGEFLSLHAKSRNVEDEALVERVLTQANRLCGEPFERQTKLTSLSGGQSRALMIADTAILSASPIVLIDEIENAGIDRKKAIDLLRGEDKIVLAATHDPMLALMAEARIRIRNGRITGLERTRTEEQALLEELFVMNERIESLRRALRDGASLV